MDRKSQVQIFETIAVLMIFFILITLGFVFYSKFANSSINSQREDAAQIDSVSMAQRVIFMPELQCNGDNVVNCVDKLKLESAPPIISANQAEYFDLLGFSDVTVLQVYPTTYKWTIYSKKIKDYSASFTTTIPVSIYEPTGKLYTFGMLNITSYTK